MHSVDSTFILQQLQADADKIRATISTQRCSCITECKAFEEVIDTQMYGLSCEVHFAVRAGLVDANSAQSILRQLEIELNQLYADLYKEE